MPSSRDDEIMRASTFHEWWLAELRSSIAPTEIDNPPPEPAPSPERSAMPRARPRGVLAFACALGLFAGATTMAVVDSNDTAHASEPARSPPVVEGIVEVGEIRVVNSPGDPTPAPLAAFDRTTAARALQASAASASTCSDGKRRAPSRISVTFQSTGRISSVLVQSRVLRSSNAGSCLVEQLRTVRVPAFSGPTATVHTTVRLP